MTLMEVIQALNARITDGAEYMWQCYGEDARYLDFNDQDGNQCASIIFDSRTQVVYTVELTVPGQEQCFKWNNPEFREVYITECLERGQPVDNAWDNIFYTTIDDDATILSYAADIGGTYYDNLPVPDSHPDLA